MKNGIIENAFRPELGSGALTDIGVYLIECAVNLFGEPINFIGNNYRLYTEAIGQGSVIFTYDDMDCVIMYSKIIDSFSPCQIIGEEGIIEFSNINRLSRVKFIDRNKNEEILIDDDRPAMSYEIEHFIYLVKNNLTDSYVHPLNFTGLSIKLMDEINNF